MSKRIEDGTRAVPANDVLFPVSDGSDKPKNLSLQQIKEFSTNDLSNLTATISALLGLYEDREPITLVAAQTGKAIVPITTGSEYGKVETMAGASVSREYQLTRGDLLKIKPGKTSNALFTVSQVVTNKDGSKTYTKVMSLNEAAEVPKDGYLNFLVMPSDMTVVITFFSGEPDFNSTVRVMRCGTFASICTQVGNIYNELHSQYMRIDGYSALARVGLADNLASRGEASAETIRYRQSGGENAIESGTATVEKIKGKTVVMNQLVSEVVSVFGDITKDGNTYIISPNKTTSLFVNIRCNFVTNHTYLIRYKIKGENIRSGEVGSVVLGGLSIKGKPLPGNNIWENYFFIFTAKESGKEALLYYTYAITEVGDNMYIKDLQITDLTQEFGTGNEPSTPEEFAKRLGYNSIEEVPYMKYNEGELVNNCVEGVKTTGFNLWDEQWEPGGIRATDGTEYGGNNDRIRFKNYMPVIPNSTLYLRCIGTSGQVCMFDKDKNFVTTIYSINTTFVVPSNVVFIRCQFGDSSHIYSKYTNDICINYSDPQKNGQYEPYWESVRSWKETINRYFPDGMKANLGGSVYDEMGAKKAVKRMGVEDLGSAVWSLSASDTGVFMRDIKSMDKMKTALDTILVGWTPIVRSQWESTSVDLNYTKNNGAVTFFFRDSTCSSAEEFRAKMQGKYLIYPLAEPEEYEYDELNLSYKVDAGGTEEAVIPEGKESTALSADIVYGIDAWGTIKSNKERITEAEGKPAMTLTADEVTKLRALINVSPTNMEE